MFIGEYYHNLDKKNRIIVPSKFRESLGDIFICTKGLDGCLNIYTNDQWKILIEKLEQLPTTKKESRLYIRGITAKAIECSCDNLGRIQLPSFLVSEAKLVKNCVFVGVADHVELWGKEVWDEYYSNASEILEEVAENL